VNYSFKCGGTAGYRTRVSAKIPLPKGVQWQKFLMDSQNKDEVFQYISDKHSHIHIHSSKYLLTTKANLVLSNKPTDLEALVTISARGSRHTNDATFTSCCQTGSHQGLPEDSR